MKTRTRAVIDVSGLPDVSFGPSDIMWWGSFGFVVIEGFTLALCTVVYVYLTQNAESWPPPHTPRPSLVIPTIQLVLMLASLPFVGWLDRATKRYDLARVRIGFTIAALWSLAFVGLRVVELLVSLRVRWDTNAYGSAQWLVIGYHGTLVLVESAEVIGLALAYWFAPVEDRHFPDGSDALFYWRFMVIAWIPLYVLCFLVPSLR